MCVLHPSVCLKICCFVQNLRTKVSGTQSSALYALMAGERRTACDISSPHVQKLSYRTNQHQELWLDEPACHIKDPCNPKISKINFSATLKCVYSSPASTCRARLRRHELAAPTGRRLASEARHFSFALKLNPPLFCCPGRRRRKHQQKHSRLLVPRACRDPHG